MGRWIRFFIMMGIGAALGLVYAWKVSPVKYVGTTPEMLRIDYKTDYVLMTAEAYSLDGDPSQAAERLALLGNEDPEEAVLQAVLFGEEHGYTEDDLALMRALAVGLGDWEASQKTETP